MNLSTTYLGLNLAHPIVPSASPLSSTFDGVRELEDAGASAIVLPSLFEEQLEGEMHLTDHYMNRGMGSEAETLSYFPELDSYSTSPGAYLNLIRQAKESVAVPIIGSLNCVATGSWIDFAKSIEEAGADALELNIYFMATGSYMDSVTVEEEYVDIVRAIKKEISIPLSVKLGPYFSAFAHMARRFYTVGANGLVLFNRFYQPDFDIEKLEVLPNLELSTANELRLPLRWVSILNERVPMDYAITSGIHSYEDVIKGILAGAKVTMLASELLANGVGRIGEIRQGLEIWLDEYEYGSVEEIRGLLSQSKVNNPEAFERANYMKVMQSRQADDTKMGNTKMKV